MTWCCGAGAFLLVLWVLFGTALLVGALALSKTLLDRRRSSTETGASARNRPLEILEERYARGEIDADEFQGRRRAFGSQRADEDRPEVEEAD